MSDTTEPPTTGRGATALNRRRWLAAGVAVTVTAVVSTTVGITHTHHSHTPHEIRAIAWRPIEPALRTAFVEAAGTVTPPSCRAASLSATSDSASVAAGEYYLPVTVANTGSDECALQMSDVTLVSKAVSIIGALATGKSNAKATVVVPGGASAQLMVALPDACAGSLTGNPSGVSLSVVQHLVTVKGASLPSGLAQCTHGTVVPWKIASDGPSAFPTLTAAANLPAAARAGQTMNYSITLTNTGSSAVTLSPCPTYTEELGPEATVTSSYLLDCQAASPIAAGGSEVFDMVIAVPSRAAGVGKLAWSFDGGPYAGGTVSID